MTETAKGDTAAVIRPPSIPLAAVVGAEVGLVAMPVLTCATVSLFWPHVWHDGQAFLLLFVPMPVGALVGATAMAAWSLCDQQRFRTAARLCGTVGTLLLGAGTQETRHIYLTRGIEQMLTDEVGWGFPGLSGALLTAVAFALFLRRR